VLVRFTETARAELIDAQDWYEAEAPGLGRRFRVKPSVRRKREIFLRALPGGIERTEEEYRFLLEQADFQLNSISPTASVITVVEAKPI
jgi:hypothetical protein